VLGRLFDTPSGYAADKVLAWTDEETAAIVAADVPSLPPSERRARVKVALTAVQNRMNGPEQNQVRLAVLQRNGARAVLRHYFSGGPDRAADVERRLAPAQREDLAAFEGTHHSTDRIGEILGPDLVAELAAGQAASSSPSAKAS
jgi:hypothetical protein